MASKAFYRVLTAVGLIALLLILLATRSTPNGSTDGRFHTCNYVTEQGVTEHLTEYKQRCNPNQTKEVTR